MSDKDLKSLCDKLIKAEPIVTEKDLKEAAKSLGKK